ncbi:LuxR family transcriptional regulator [Saccharothrix sp. NRRL B-16348]|uniref:ATP-binding protein n=1 Tax=Saccharothrix sp. NRRL B-16348 TaxID=1415542 RepID=UPI0006B0023B|nr:AAA family ATPase [Saccharothrix sp. NRRL B-16348]KOX16050.1 LuxR family transcriptional regulator [Saccharothrix sp. NRRL B-16348]
MASVNVRGVSPVLVGREAELAALAEVYEVAVAEGAAVAVVEGEAGIGKSRLVGEFTARLGTAARNVRGECLELGADSLPFAPFTAVVRRLRRELGGDLIRDLLPAGGLSLARWLPELGAPAVDQDPFQGRSRLFDEVLTLLEGAAARQPLVVVLEDLHWADPGSRDLLAYLVRNVEQPGLLLVGTYRSSDVGEAHPLRPLVVDIARRPRGLQFELTPLDRAQVGAQLAALLGHEPDDALVTRVHERGDGNPLFVEALAADPANATPARLRDLLAAATARLPETGRTVLRAAAVVGHEVRHELLAPVCGLPDEELEPALRELVDRRLLVVHEDGYAFRHGLLRDVVLGGLLPGERRRLHARCAEAIVGDPALVPEGRAATELAAHWNAAGDHARTLDASWRAAADACRAYAYEQQLRLLDRVLDRWDAVPEPAARLGVRRAVVLHHAAGACVHTGDFERGITLATRALDELDPATDPEWSARVLATRGLLNRRAGRDGDADLRAALGVMPADAPPELRGQALAMLAVTVGRHDPDQGERYAEEALGLGREHGLPVVHATALIASARIAAPAGDRERALALFREAATIAEAASDHYDALTALLGQAYLLMGAGDYDSAAVVAAQARATAHRVGQARSRGADLAGVLARALWFVGRWAEARVVVEDALADDPPAMTTAVLMTLLGEILLAQGEVDAAADVAARSAADPTGRGMPVFVAAFRCRLAVARRDLDAADRLLADALADPGLLGPFGDPWTLLRAGAGVRRALLDAAGRDESRRELVERRTGQLRDVAAQVAADDPVGAAHRASFDAEIAEGDPRLWAAAVAAWRGRSQPYELAQALFGAAESALSTGDRTAAEASVREAAALADDLGAGHLRHEIDLLAARGRIDLTPEPPPPPSAAPFDLTARELDVLRLLADGLTNSQIATTLFISASTAGVHVSRILTKLGAGRRTEAAAIAHRAGLFRHDQADGADRNPTARA